MVLVVVDLMEAGMMPEPHTVMGLGSGCSYIVEALDRQEVLADRESCQELDMAAAVVGTVAEGFQDSGLAAGKGDTT